MIFKIMNNFMKEFVMDMFLDNDSVSTVNRAVIAVAKVVNENSENLATYSDFLRINYLIDSKQRRKNKNTTFCNVLSNFSKTEYENKLKIKKNTFKELLNCLEKSVDLKNSDIPLEKRLHIFLYLLTNTCSYNKAAVLFDLHKSSVVHIFHETAALIASHKDSYIVWPLEENQYLSRTMVNNQLKFPNCVGFLDACCFEFKSKGNQNTNSVLLQAVCDESLMFINVYFELNETRKNKVFKHSPLSKQLKVLMQFENHMLGSVDYKLKTNLMTPFIEEELKTEEQVKFNELHFKAHCSITKAFDLYKKRFERLSSLEFCDLNNVKSIFNAACVLHNFILLREGHLDIKDESVMNDNRVIIDKTIVTNAREKREFLCYYLNYIDNS